MNEEALIIGRDYIIENNVLKINEGVRHIPSCCFRGLNSTKEINEIVLPSTLISIGSYAFSDCGTINRLTIPDSVIYILDEAFSYCKIIDLNLGKNVMYIGKRAFSYNDIQLVKNNSVNLKLLDICAFFSNNKLSNFSINTDENVYIEESAFDETLISIEDSYEKEYKNATIFDKYFVTDPYSKNQPICMCSLETIDEYKLVDGVLTIDDGVEILVDFKGLADLGCTTIVMPNSVKIIGPNAFSGIPTLEKIVFSDSLIIIEGYAFSDCSLRKNTIKLPESLCFINLTAFNNNEGINAILLPNTCQKESLSTNGNYDSVYQIYTNDINYPKKRNKQNLSLPELLESDKEELENVGLLQETIKNNCDINNRYNLNQSLIIESSLIKFINNKDYDEEKEIDYVRKILELKVLDISEIHEVINYLFTRKQTKTIYLLISYGYNYMNNSIISRAIINDMNEMVDILILIGANINEIGTINMSALSIACQKGDLYLAKHLIEKGAAINLVDSNNKKAIDYAIENNNYAIVNLINGYNDLEKSEAEKDMEEINRILGK